MIIYMVKNKINGKMYIGQTINSLEKRKWKHINCALRKIDNIYFHNALRKYGADLFEWTVIDRCATIEQLNKLEIFYIGFHNTFGEGYNLTEGGDGSMGRKYSELSKLKMSIAKKGKIPSEATIMGRRNKKVSEETLEKISGENNHSARGVIINGERFPTLIAAAKSLGVVHTTITNRIRKKVKGYSYA